MQSYLDALSTAALLGTEKRSLPDLPERLQHLVKPQATIEAQLLVAGVAAKLYVQVAQDAKQNLHSRRAAAAEEKLEVISEKAASYLGQFIQGRQQGLLQEFLTVAAQHHKRVPFYYLPDLLELARMNSQLREQLRACIGERGHWLAAQNSQWGFALGDDQPLERFETGSLTERLIAFRTMRQTDPENARQRLEADWTKNSAKDRTALLEGLTEGLSLSDESFLEEALKDRSASVRAAAAELLSQLPDAAYTERMKLRAKGLLSYKPAGMLGLKGAGLELSLPSPPETEEDGIEVPSVVKGMGKKAWWFKQIVARVPLSFWPAEVKKLLEAAKKEDKDLLFEAFVAATIRFKDSQTARSLIDFDEKGVHLSSLLPLIPHEEVSDLALALINRFSELSYSHPLIQLLGLYRFDWSETFTKKFKESLKKSLQGKNTWELRRVLELFAEAIPPEQLESLKPLLSQDTDHPHSAAYRDFLAKLELRGAMIASLKET